MLTARTRGRRFPTARTTLSTKWCLFGATSFTVDSTSGYNVGDTILVHRPSPQQWIDDIGMTTIGTWTPGLRDVNVERRITYIDQTQKRVFFDAPLVNAIEKKYTDTSGNAGTVSKYTFNRTTNVGVENLRGNGQAVLTTPDDEMHANSFVVMQDTGDSWARNITGQHLVYATMEAGTNSRNITLDGGTSIEPISQITGGRRYPFNIEGAFVLMKNMTSDEGRHEFVNNSPSRGPNVFLDGTATHGHADSGTHQRYSVGTLWDNITTNTDLDVQNRYSSGTGHGWSGRTWSFGIPTPAIFTCKAHRRRRIGLSVPRVPFTAVHNLAQACFQGITTRTMSAVK